MPEYAQPSAQPNDPSNFAFFGCADPRLRPALSAFLVHGGYLDLLVEAPAEAANAATTGSALASRMRLPRVVFIPSNYIMLSVRLRKRPRVKQGGRYQVGVGEIEVDSIEQVPFAAITGKDVRRAGEPDRETLRQRAAHAGPIEGDTLVYRIELSFMR